MNLMLLFSELRHRLQSSSQFVHPDDLLLNSCTELIVVPVKSEPPDSPSGAGDSPGDSPGDVMALANVAADSQTVDNKLCVVQDILSSGKRLYTHRSEGIADCDDSLVIDVEELGE